MVGVTAYHILLEKPLLEWSEDNLSLIGAVLQRSEIGEISEIDVSLKDLYTFLNNLPLAYPWIQRVSVKPKDDTTATLLLKKIRHPDDALTILDLPDRNSSPYIMACYADEAYEAQAFAAIGSYLIHNPTHRIIFIDGGINPTLRRRLESGKIEVVPVSIIEEYFGFCRGSLREQYPIHLSVARKIMSRLYLLENHQEPVLFGDSDLLYYGKTDTLFGDDAPLSATIDWMDTEIYCNREAPHRASVGGFLQTYIEKEVIKTLFGEIDPKKYKDHPYFNSGFLLLRPQEAILDLLRAALSLVVEHPKEFESIYPWPEQTILNTLVCIKGINWRELDPQEWNFHGRRVRHLFGSQGKKLKGYKDHWRLVNESWRLFGQDFWPPVRGSKIYLGWAGEFGWEISLFYPLVRYLSQRYEVTIATFEDTIPLYKDLNVNCISNKLSERRFVGVDGELSIPKEFQNETRIVFKDNEHLDSRSDMIHMMLSPGIIRQDLDMQREDLILVHARSLNNHPQRNWTSEDTKKLERAISAQKVCFIGSTTGSMCPDRYEDLRGISMEGLVKQIKKAKCVLGPDSGPIHLAKFCGTPVFTWGCPDDRHDPNSDLGKLWSPLPTLCRHQKSWEADDLELFLGELG